MPAKQEAAPSVRIINKSRYALDLVSKKTKTKPRVQKLVPARGRVDVTAEEWARLEGCPGDKMYRTKLHWLIVVKPKGDGAAQANLADLPEKAALETASFTEDVETLHEMLDAETRPDVKDAIQKQIDRIADASSKPSEMSASEG